MIDVLLILAFSVLITALIFWLLALWWGDPVTPGRLRERRALQSLERVSRLEHELGIEPCVMWQRGCWEYACIEARIERQRWMRNVMRGGPSDG